MSELESSLNKILEEHQHESGLHMIGGRRRLLNRLVQFFEEFQRGRRGATAPPRGKTTDLMLTMNPISRKMKRITIAMSTRIPCLLGEGFR